jgi:pimeloyl-ACP methyl ester carboxylesterase
MHTARAPVPIVLVHGALHGAWCWECVVPPLEAAGHAVIAVDMPGSDPGSDPAQVTLATYTDAVLGALRGRPRRRCWSGTHSAACRFQPQRRRARSTCVNLSTCAPPCPRTTGP